MAANLILVRTAHRQTRRQVARALHSGGLAVDFFDRSEELLPVCAARNPGLVILDCDDRDTAAIERALHDLQSVKRAPPVVLMSVSSDKGPLLELLQHHEVGNLVAKHGAIRAVYPVIDERELLVTCNKVIQRDIFGIEKYVGSWGVVLHRASITSVLDKAPFLHEFEEYLNELDCPQSVVPAIVTVAEELILNAVVHGPHLPDGEPKYEQMGVRPDLVLDPSEYVDVAYGCDGQRLMLAVNDNFGRLSKRTLYNYLNRGFESGQMEAETKPGGAGLGLSLSFRSIHQLIFNVQDSVRTEVIAGWYLRVSTASEFRQVGKSLNIFWLPADNQPVEVPSPVKVREQRQGRLATRLDETTDLAGIEQATELDLRDLATITSRGLLHWLKFIRAARDRGLTIRGCPEPLVRLAVEVAGVLEGVTVKTIMVPFECTSCSHEERIELRPDQVFEAQSRRCLCGAPLRFAGVTEQFRRFLRIAHAA